MNYIDFKHNFQCQFLSTNCVVGQSTWSARDCQVLIKRTFSSNLSQLDLDMGLQSRWKPWIKTFPYLKLSTGAPANGGHKNSVIFLRLTHWQPRIHPGRWVISIRAASHGVIFARCPGGIWPHPSHWCGNYSNRQHVLFRWTIDHSIFGRRHTTTVFLIEFGM